LSNSTKEIIEESVPRKKAMSQLRNLIKTYSTALSEHSQIRVITNPIHLLTTVLLSVFLAETMIMLLIDNTLNTFSYREIVLDTSLLVLVRCPILYFLLFKPFQYQIEERDQVLKKYTKQVYELIGTNANDETFKPVFTICIYCKKNTQ
jgi:hypothetical protein